MYNNDTFLDVMTEEISEEVYRLHNSYKNIDIITKTTIGDEKQLDVLESEGIIVLREQT